MEDITILIIYGDKPSFHSSFSSREAVGAFLAQQTRGIAVVTNKTTPSGSVMIDLTRVPHGR